MYYQIYQEVCTMLTIQKDIDFPMNASIQATLCNIKHSGINSHDNAIELIFCLQGTFSMRSSHRHITLNAGDVFSIDPGDVHCMYSESDNLILIIHINRYTTKYSQERISNCFLACETQHMSYLQRSPMYQVKDLMLAAYLQAYYNDDLVSQKQTADQLLDLLVEHFDWLSFIWDPMNTNTFFHERFHRIIHYCQENYKEKITVKQLAEMEHINKNYFSSFLSKTSFYNFSNMLNFIRCDAAEKLLITTDVNVIEISSICGFSDPKYFYKHFASWWSMSPAKLRKWYKEYAEIPEEVYIYSLQDGSAVIRDYLPLYHLERVQIK